MLLKLSRRAETLTKEANVTKVIRAVGSLGDDAARSVRPSPNLASLRNASTPQPLARGIYQPSPQELSLKADALLSEFQHSRPSPAAAGRPLFNRPPIDTGEIPQGMPGPSAPLREATSHARPPPRDPGVDSRYGPAPSPPPAAAPADGSWKKPAMIAGAAGAGIGLGAGLDKQAGVGGVGGGALKLLGNLTMGTPFRRKVTGTALLTGGFGAHAAKQGMTAQHMDVPNMVGGAPSPHGQIWDAAQKYGPRF